MRSVTERYESMAQRGRTPEQIRAVAIARDDRELRDLAEQELRAQAESEVFA
jgi:hypothetical protein